jgi:hypothetical protein
VERCAVGMRMVMRGGRGTRKRRVEVANRRMLDGLRLETIERWHCDSIGTVCVSWKLLALSIQFSRVINLFGSERASPSQSLLRIHRSLNPQISPIIPPPLRASTSPICPIPRPFCARKKIQSAFTPLHSIRKPYQPPS